MPDALILKLFAQGSSRLNPKGRTNTCVVTSLTGEMY